MPLSAGGKSKTELGLDSSALPDSDPGLSRGWTEAPSLALFLRSHQALLPNCISKCLTDKLRKGRVLIENTQDVRTQGERGAEGVGTGQTKKTNKDKG